MKKTIDLHSRQHNRCALADKFEFYLHSIGFSIPKPETEFRFCIERKWRFDYAWRNERAFVELEGGTWVGGRHTRGTGYTADCEKYNAAALLGWRGLRFTSDMLTNDPQSCINSIRHLLHLPVEVVSVPVCAAPIESDKRVDYRVHALTHVIY